MECDLAYHEFALQACLGQHAGNLAPLNLWFGVASKGGVKGYKNGCKLYWVARFTKVRLKNILHSGELRMFLKIPRASGIINFTRSHLLGFGCCLNPWNVPTKETFKLHLIEE